jgi:hypothetical protein
MPAKGGTWHGAEMIENRQWGLIRLWAGSHVLDLLSAKF